MGAGILEIGGTIFSNFGSINALRQLYKDFTQWEEKDKIVDYEWLELAVKQNLLTGKLDEYRWSRPDKVETRILKNTHYVVNFYDDEKRIRARIFLRDGSVLMRRITD